VRRLWIEFGHEFGCGCLRRCRQPGQGADQIRPQATEAGAPTTGRNVHPAGTPPNRPPHPRVGRFPRAWSAGPLPADPALAEPAAASVATPAISPLPPAPKASTATTILEPRPSPKATYVPA